MTDDEVKDYLADNPQVSDDIVAIMTASQLPAALVKLVDVQAKVDAALLKDALDDKNPQRNPRPDRQGQRAAAAINKAIADNDGDGKPDKLMTAAQASYITNWTNRPGRKTSRRSTAWSARPSPPLPRVRPATSSRR